MDQRSFLLIANPEAGRGRGKKIAEKVRTTLQAHFPVTCCYPVDEKHLWEITKEKANGHSDILVVGGDGTIHQVVNAMGPNHLSTLCIVPAGTGNDFTKVVDIGKTLYDQINTILNGKTRTIDLGICNERLFINGVGIGFDGQIVYEMLHRKTWLSGHAAYYYHVLRILAGYKERPFNLLLDSIQYQKDLILMTVGNGTTFGGGFKLTPNAAIDDGLLDICLVGKLSPLRRFLNVPKLSNGSHLSLPEIEERRVKEVEVKGNDLLEAHIDGEYLGKPPFNIKVLPKALSVRVRH